MLRSRSAQPSKCLKRNFVKENSKSQAQKHVDQEYPSGTFTIHHPSRCYHILDHRPIHLKRDNPTDGKEFVRILTQEFIRDLLVPQTSNLYPAVMHVSEMDRMKIKSLRLTNEEKQANIHNIENANKHLKVASDERKALIAKWDEMNN